VKKTWALAIALTLGAVALQAQPFTCTTALKFDDERFGQRYSITWDPVPHADTYILERSTDNFRTTVRREYVDANPTFLRDQVGYQATKDVRVKFRLTARDTQGQLIPCSDTKELIFSPDVNFRRIVQKSVIPLVGSTPGLNGSQFKTSLRLRATEDGQSGKLVFRRANVYGSDRDPSLNYSFTHKGDVVNFEDIGATFGIVGLGSLDIVPDANAPAGTTVPFAEVRLFNVASNGTFGTIEAQTQPFAFSDGFQSISFVVPSSDMRVNMGARSFSASIIIVNIYRGSTQIGQAVHTPPGDTLLFGSANEITGVQLQPGDRVTVNGQGNWIPLYTLTDNRTNDPALFVPPAKIDFEVGQYAIEK